MKEEPKRWKDVFHYGFGYTVCPYCGDETGWYNPASQRFQTDLKNNQREHCPKCGKRVYAREGWLMNQPEEDAGMLEDILEQRERLINQHWRRDLEVHMNLDDYHRLLAETGAGYYFEHRPGCSRIYGMDIVIDGSEKPCVKVAEDRIWI